MFKYNRFSYNYILKKHRGHPNNIREKKKPKYIYIYLLSGTYIYNLSSFLKPELNHPIIEPNFYWVLYARYCVKHFHIPWELYSHNSHNAMTWASAVWSDLHLDHDSGGWWMKMQSINIYFLGKCLYFNTKESLHFYPFEPPMESCVFSLSYNLERRKLLCCVIT